MGIKNVRFRLTYLVNGTMEIISRPQEGTTVTITIPGEGKGTKDKGQRIRERENESNLRR